MSSAFSSNDVNCVTMGLDQPISDIDKEHIWNEYRLNDCVQWIKKHSFTRICLQFPDNLLSFSTTILQDLENNTNVKLCILGDTSYASCCVDEVAASHFSADAIIHFGHACFSKVINYPVFYVFAHLPIDVSIFGDRMNDIFLDNSRKFVIFYSDEYFYELDKIRAFAKSRDNIKLAEIAIDTPSDILCWKLPEPNLSDCVCIYLGVENQTFFNLTVSVKANTWLCYNPQKNELKDVISPLSTNWMRRRLFFVEKCKDSQSLGIIVGTLTANGYLDVVERIQKLARVRGIRTYLLSVGKVNPAKIANFHEIDCFVYVGCPENNIYTSRDFYKPLLSVFEVEIALNPAWNKKYPDLYSVDFSEILPLGKHHCDASESKTPLDEYDVSLVTGKVRSMQTHSIVNNDGKQIEKKCNQMMESSSSQSFQTRSWTGLSTNLALQDPARIVEGRSGIPMKYSENIE